MIQVGPDGTVFSYGNSFYSGGIPAADPLTRRDINHPVEALRGAVDALQLPIRTEGASAVAMEGTESYSLEGTSGAAKTPKAQLVYLMKNDGSLALSWRVETDVVDNWLLSYVDAAASGEVHAVVDWVSDLATYKV